MTHRHHMRKLIKDVDLKFILTSFFVWKALLYFFQFISLKYLSVQSDFLGGGLSAYQDSPYLWGWANFDGQHYLSIAQNGYKPLTYFFFPVYPLLVGLLSKPLDSSTVSHLMVGQLISNASLVVALIGLWKLIKIGYTNSVAKTSIVLLLLFPTSFYFAGVYTESLFLALIVWSFYFARTKNWLLAGILGGVSTATRIVGLALLPALLAEAWVQRKGSWGNWGHWRNIMLTILLVPSGLLIYMYFLSVKTGDPLEFLNSIDVFGEQRSSSFVLLPRVFYRYVFKVLPNVNYSYLPVVFTTWLEFVAAIVFGGLGILGLLVPHFAKASRGKRFGKLGKIRLARFPLSYAVYLIVGYLIPTLSGSFSSLPRYVLVLFPAYILMAIYLIEAPKYVQTIIYSLLFIGLGVATSLFLRGYWIA